MKKYIIIIFLVIPVINITLAQQKDVFEPLGEDKSIYDLSLEELFNTNVSSVSKKSESLFEAPLSASVVTSEEIKNSGATSIPEALRLMPGLIVREQTNGVYEVFVRGGENSAPYSHLPYFGNTTTLVMIDGRPVYNYLQGGTFWETLPVDLNDVERIELVRGAMAALYGPNAVSGVINIITRKPKNYTVYSYANAQYGTNNTLIANGSLGYKWNQKLDVTVSGNMQKRDRYNDTYYTYATNDYVKLDQITNLFGGEMLDLKEKFPNPEKALDKKGANLFLNYNPLDKVRMEIAVGMEDSWVQKVYSENSATPFSTSVSNTKYGDFRLKMHNLSGQVSLLQGTQSPALSTFGLKYDMKSMDAFFEYDFIIGSKNEGLESRNFGEFQAGFLPKGHSISIRPGFNFRKAIYDDTPYFEKGAGFINAKGELVTTALSAKLDYDIIKKFRLTAAFRNDQHNYPENKSFLSYQTSAKYHIDSKNIIRATYSRAYRSVYIYDTYSDFSLGANFPKTHPIYESQVYPGIAMYLLSEGMASSFEEGLAMAPHVVNTARYAFTYEGNQNLDLLKIDMIELGYRSRFSDNISVDIEGYKSKTDGFVYPLTVSESTAPVMLPTTRVDVVSEALNVNLNYPQELHQYGVTLSVNYLDNDIQVKPYITLQKSKFKKFNTHIEDLGDPENEVVFENRDHKGTPVLFGGAYMNYKINKFNFNLNPYFLSKSELLHDYSFLRGDLELPLAGAGHMYNKSKMVLNARIGYQLTSNLDIFVSGKNITAAKSPEYFFTDNIPASVLFGINFNY